MAFYCSLTSSSGSYDFRLERECICSGGNDRIGRDKMKLSTVGISQQAPEGDLFYVAFDLASILTSVSEK